MKSTKLNNYQVCYTKKEGKKYSCISVENITADSIADAYIAMKEKTNDEKTFFIYPLAVSDNGESVYAMADYVRKQYHRFALANNNTAETEIKLTDDDNWERRQNASVGVLLTFEVDKNANMFIVYNSAYNYLTGKQREFNYIREVEIDPNSALHNPMIERTVRATYPELDALIAKAIELACLSKPQMEVLEMAKSGTSPKDIQELLGITRASYYDRYYSAIYKMLSTAVQLDGEYLPTFKLCGLTEDDVMEELNAYKKRARVK